MKLLVTGAAGFIGSTYVRLAKEEHEVRVLDKLTYAGRRENLPADVELVEGAIEDPAIVREAMEGRDAVVNFAAESHVDRSIDDQDAFARTHVIGTGVLLDTARELGASRYLQVSTDEVYGSISPAPHRDLAARPLLALLGDQGGRRAPRHRPCPHLRDRGFDRPRLQQLRAAPVSREVDPSDGPERSARGLAAGVWRWTPGAQLALRRGLLPRHPHRPAQRPRRGGLQRRRPRRVREHRRRQAGDRADRRR